MSNSNSRFPFIDALKALASQLIVLHHLALYGPMSDSAYELVPVLIGWLSEYGRQAVPVFLVVGGFLAARSLAPRGRLMSADPLALIWQRYVTLVLPYLTALAIAIAGAAVARMWMEHDSIPEAPTFLQIAAHVLLLQDLLDVEALSAGIWYIAIDFQLFALLVALLWLARRAEGAVPGRRQFGPALLVVAGCASLFFFNRDPAWDVSAFYFVGAHTMGVLCYWASARGRSPVWLVALAAVTGAALMLDFRSRLVVALAVTLALGLARRRKFLERWPDVRPIAFLGPISYSVFLVHFPVCLVVNALFYRFAGDDPVANLAGMAVAWVASTAAGALFFRLVEDPVREVRLATT